MFSWRFKLILLLAQALFAQAGYIGGIPAAGLLGNYAGALSAGEALSKLDFSDSDAHADHEHLGALAEQLSEHSFPADYGSSDAGEEYAEASEHHEHHYEPEIEEHHHHHDEQPVPGIDHGKGAFSYSTLYEFKDREEHEKQQLEHQLEEQHVEQQLELEHQIHVFDNHHHDHHQELDLH
ncbi:histidine-rich glycoprotein [Drosophila sulfurigaster albostrigata]|uniref:histidine-rich glycoprotein n=1 Tax=Drosophila sulfurigaster albostrigata TaxID=89887 RepID=UPI002D21C280|nr:histidine-rich glycoprotein [Drosophila sulfurigaster albostrigata]